MFFERKGVGCLTMIPTCLRICNIMSLNLSTAFGSINIFLEMSHPLSTRAWASETNVLLNHE
jgi:hypothetical protein